jgi:hypothetical protein
MYEDFSCLPGRAGHAQFARLLGTQLIVIPSQRPKTGSGEVAPLRDSRLDAGRVGGGGQDTRLDIYRRVFTSSVVSRG